MDLQTQSAVLDQPPLHAPGVITDVLISKRQQLISSCFMTLVLMLASSLRMSGLESAAQLEVFSNAFFGIW